MLNNDMPTTTEVKQITDRCNVLTRELGMLRIAQTHLSGIPARHNAQRIADRQEELDTLLASLDVITRFGNEELARCESLS